ncbi:Uridine nucleosidase 1 [Apostasia shenzhenica]|uniref:Uridine nucleosidase 1 n=1 Tax=Apostasia shenzhenica TaxID=1088818 RepID=A0A2I0AZD5_9ASPA|nr:Uridine nucleosidase 1 [Apostasia shenzhenica]
MKQFRGEMLLFVLVGVLGLVAGRARRILLDTDVDTDDLFALLYILKQNRSEFDLKAVTISANAWSDAGHAVNHIYDILYMMNRDDIAVGVGGDGGISDHGIILPNVGGYLPLIEQGLSTAGYCRYRQAIPLDVGGRMHANTNYGLRRGFLPQGSRKYTPLAQPTAQQVMTQTISAGLTTVFLIGSHTNFALFLMTNSHLKKNIEHIYIMGGGVRSENPTGCCPKNASASCEPQQCGDPGNLFTSYSSNPYAEFNIFADPFAAYQVFHSGTPVTLVPLDATNTIPIDVQFFMAFEQHQITYEAQYCFQSLKMARDTLYGDRFYMNYFMWDSFTSGVALSLMRNTNNSSGQNEFAVMEYRNITVVTSNKPYGISDGSNPFFDGRTNPKFDLRKGGIHSGHVQMGPDDPFCFMETKKKGRCEDGYTMEVVGSEAVCVLTATHAKPSQDINSQLHREFFRSFLEVLNLPQHQGRFNFATQFPYYKEIFYIPNFKYKKIGPPLVFDMDMSAGDFLALIFLLKVPVEVIDLKAILVTCTGWANAATIDIIYDVLHMMGRDDIPVGLGNPTAIGTPILGCKYVQAIPHGSGGFIDSDTLYGLARTLPRSPRRFTPKNSLKYGYPLNCDHPELQQLSALEVWQSVLVEVDPTQKVTVLTNGPLTNLANIILSDKKASSMIQNLYIVGGNVIGDHAEEGNIFTIPSNKYAEFNMYLDPLAARTVFESDLEITIIPLHAQRQVCSFPEIIRRLQLSQKTPELEFSLRLLSLLHKLRQKHQIYHHMDIFLGEILGAVFLTNHPHLDPALQVKPIKVSLGDTATDGQLFIDERNGKFVNILHDLDSEAYYGQYAKSLSSMNQSAVAGSFDEQKKQWSSLPYSSEIFTTQR